MGRHAPQLCHFTQAIGVGAVLRADDEDHVRVWGHELDRILAVLGGIADVVLLRADDAREPRTQRADNGCRVVHRQGGLGDVGQLVGIRDHEARHILRFLDQMDPALRLAHGALDLGVPLVPDHDDLLALLAHACHFDVHLGDQRAGRVKNAQAAPLGFLPYRERHAVGGEDHRVAGRHFIELVDEDGTLAAQVVHDELVVHDLVAHINRCSEALQCTLDDLDRAFDARAKAARVGEQDFLVVHSFVSVGPVRSGDADDLHLEMDRLACKRMVEIDQCRSVINLAHQARIA